MTAVQISMKQVLKDKIQKSLFVAIALFFITGNIEAYNNNTKNRTTNYSKWHFVKN